MIKFKTGNILNEDVEALVNTVNCVGVMGRGIALQFKEHFPLNFKKYAIACKLNEVKPGKMFVFKTGKLINPKFIINFPTKRHWRGKSRIEDIIAGLKDLENVVANENIKSIALPPLGCGLGGLNWNQIRPLIENFSLKIPNTEVIVFEPKSTPKRIYTSVDKEFPEMTSGRAILIKLIKKYQEGLLDTEITLLELHKLLYFAQETGEPLRLRFEKAIFGPYANNLRHVLNMIDGHYILGYGFNGDNPDKPIHLVPGAIEKADMFLKTTPTSKRNLDKVLQLVAGFESSFGLELLATVHWSMKHSNDKDVDKIIKDVYDWNERKKQFSEMQIKIAYNELVSQNWI